MWADLLVELAQRHRFKITGALVGFIFALLVIRYGLLWALFILLCTGVGYYVGKRLDEGDGDVAEVLNRFIPPGGGAN